MSCGMHFSCTCTSALLRFSTCALFLRLSCRLPGTREGPAEEALPVLSTLFFFIQTLFFEHTFPRGDT